VNGGFPRSVATLDSNRGQSNKDSTPGGESHFWRAKKERESV